MSFIEEHLFKLVNSLESELGRAGLPSKFNKNSFFFQQKTAWGKRGIHLWHVYDGPEVARLQATFAVSFASIEVIVNAARANLKAAQRTGTWTASLSYNGFVEGAEEYWRLYFFMDPDELAKQITSQIAVHAADFFSRFSSAEEVYGALKAEGADRYSPLYQLRARTLVAAALLTRGPEAALAEAAGRRAAFERAYGQPFPPFEKFLAANGLG